MLVVVVLGAALGVLLSQRGTDNHVATSTIVLNDPQSQSENSLLPVSPDLYVNGQVALFGLEDLWAVAAERGTEALREGRRIASVARTTVGTDAIIEVDGSVLLGEPARISVRDRAVTVDGVPGAPGISPSGIVRTETDGAVLDPRLGGIELEEGDQAIVRSDGLLVVNQATGGVAAVSPTGQAITADDPTADGRIDIVGGAEAEGDGTVVDEPVSEATALGFVRSTGGRYSVTALDRLVEFSADGRAVLLDADGELVRRPDTGAVVGPDADTILVDDLHVVTLSDEDIVVVENDGAIVVLTRFGEIIASTENAPVEAAEVDYSDIVPFTPEEIELGLGTTSVPDSFVIEVSFRAESPERATAGANAAIAAYQQLQEQSANGQNAQALARADQTLARLTDDLVVAETRLTELRLGSGIASQVQDQYDEVLAQLALTGVALLNEPASEEAVQGNRLRDLLTQLDAIETVARLELDQPEIAEAVAERDQIRLRLSELQIERDALVVAAAASPRTVAIESPALDAEEVSGLGSGPLAVVGGVFGLIVGAALAYAIELRAPKKVSDPYEIEQLLDAPLLGQIPDYRVEKIRDPLPVLTHPDSTVAEAYRIAAAATTIGARSRKAIVVGVASAEARDGKTSTAVNLALALAQSGHNVLAIDADLEGHVMGTLLRLQLGERDNQPGVADIHRREVKLEDVTERIELNEHLRIDLVGAGTHRATARTLLGTGSWARLFGEARRSNHDIVIVDLPPLLSVAYASSALQELQAVIAVVPDGASYEAMQELENRIAFVKTSVLGFVHNRAEIKRERAMSMSLAQNDRWGLMRKLDDQDDGTDGDEPTSDLDDADETAPTTA